MDSILIHNLTVHYRIGVTDNERAQPQKLHLTIELHRELSGAAASEDLSKTVNYQLVVNRLLRFGFRRQWCLVETLAQDIAKMLLKAYAVSSVTVEVRKFIIPQAEYVGVRLTRPA